MTASPINTMVLGGSALRPTLSRLIDNSVVSARGKLIFRHGKWASPRWCAAERGGKEVQLAVLAATFSLPALSSSQSCSSMVSGKYLCDRACNFAVSDSHFSLHTCVANNGSAAVLCASSSRSIPVTCLMGFRRLKKPLIIRVERREHFECSRSLSTGSTSVSTRYRRNMKTPSRYV